VKVMVIAAHPDDEILGCGATTARLVKEGHEVTFAILGEGITSRHADRAAADVNQLNILRQQAHAAAEKVGVERLVLNQLPDNRLDTVPLLEVVKIVEDLVGQSRPDVIYTHHGGDLNIDHGVVYRAVLTATRPMSGTLVKDIYTFEVASSTDWGFHGIEPSFRPNVFVDVTNTIEAKIAAMECYESEARKFPHPRSPEALRAMAIRWGSVVGCGAAEAFELIRSVRMQLD